MWIKCHTDQLMQQQQQQQLINIPAAWQVDSRHAAYIGVAIFSISVAAARKLHVSRVWDFPSAIAVPSCVLIGHLAVSAKSCIGNRDSLSGSEIFFRSRVADSLIFMNLYSQSGTRGHMACQTSLSWQRGTVTRWTGRQYSRAACQFVATTAIAGYQQQCSITFSQKW